MNYWEQFKKNVGDRFDQAKQFVRDPGEAIGEALGLAYTRNLDDDYLLKLLAACAADCYEFDNKALGKDRLERIHKQEQQDMQDLNGIQFGVYKILSGNYQEKKILAYRGTYSMMGILQDASLIIPVGDLGIPIKMAVDAAVKRAEEQNADFVCGHSLGGFLAECVCARTGKRGASFNAPGPWSLNPHTNCAPGDKYDGVPFECHLTRKDPISHVGSIAGPDGSHIGRPIWREDGPESGNPHYMDAMLEHIGRL